MIAPSGEQFEIGLGDHRATIVEVGGGIRTYDVGDRRVLDPYPLDAISDGGHGSPLVPWPNRLEDGRYAFDGAEYQLPVSEPELGNAIHGLLRWRSWQPLERDPARIAIGTRLHPMPGYPFCLDVRIEYELRPDGLHVDTTVVNLGERRCPFGTGHHPYLSAGPGRLDDCELELRAETMIAADERQLPTGRTPLAGTELDFRRFRPLGGTLIDSAFTDLERDQDGRATVSLRGGDGVCVRLWAGPPYKVIQVYTGDTLAPGRRRLGLAAEPMTCPANAFRTGDDLLILEPGESFTAGWGAGIVHR